MRSSSWAAIRPLLTDPQMLGWFRLAGAMFPIGPWRLEWFDVAACRGIRDLDVFYPSKGRRYFAAKRICRRCPVRDDCGAYVDRVEAGAGYAKELEGVWGGETPLERWRRRSSA